MRMNYQQPFLAMQQAVAGLPMSWTGQTGLFKYYNQNSFATETGQQARQDANTDPSALRNGAKPRTVGNATHIACLLTCTSTARSWLSEEGPLKKLISRLQETWQLEITLSFALHMHGDGIANRVDMAIIT